jgi:hypothetical protein
MSAAVTIAVMLAARTLARLIPRVFSMTALASASSLIAGVMPFSISL